MKRILAATLVTLLTLSLIACQPLSNKGDNGDTLKDGDTIVDPEPSGEEVELTLYFANSEYIQTGNDSLGTLMAEKRNVTVTDKPVAEVAVEELLKGPQNEGTATVIPSRIKLIGVEVSNRIAYVNFSSSNMSGGSTEESFLVDAVIMTLTELEDIDAVQFLIDGRKPETLMGHIYTMEPMGRSDTVMQH